MPWQQQSGIKLKKQGLHTQSSAASWRAPFVSCASPITGAPRLRRREWDEANAAKAAALSNPITSLLLAAEHTFMYERCYLEKQPCLDAFHRAHLLDWLAAVGDRLQVHEETSFLAAVYFDRFMERVEIALHDRRLAALAALLLACKTT